MEKVLCGDALEQLRTLDAESVNVCVTSPPYYNLRDYGTAGQIGMEDSPEEYISKLVDVFREVRRCMRPDGTLWVNIGDSYTSGGRKTRDFDPMLPARRMNQRPMTPAGMKPKDLIGIPWMLAFALRADGWYLRQDIIWHKTNAMPESVRDRCTKAHEYIFLLSKSLRYYFDAATISEPIAGSSTNVPTLHRNKRDVWTIGTAGFKGAHFAVFPEKLVEPCILAGCPEGGTVLDPFAGSGTTGVVAKRLRRNFVGVEINQDYWQMAVDRIAETTAALKKREDAWTIF